MFDELGDLHTEGSDRILTPDQLLPRVHATAREIDFALNVLREYKKKFDLEDAKTLVVGSRREGHWVSRSKFNRLFIHFLPQEEIDYWFHYFDQSAIKYQYSYNQIKQLARNIPSNAPSVIKREFEHNHGPFGADIDFLVVNSINSHVPYDKVDRRTGIPVEIYRGILRPK